MLAAISSAGDVGVRAYGIVDVAPPDAQPDPG
jgi:hypothetical protein